MRILQVCPTYHSHVGGIAEHARNISERLAKDHDVTVFGTDPSGDLPKEEMINGVKVRRFRSWALGDAYWFYSENSLGVELFHPAEENRPFFLRPLSSGEASPSLPAHMSPIDLLVCGLGFERRDRLHVKMEADQCRAPVLQSDLRTNLERVLMSVARSYWEN
jgi:glycosyltransferase involved in cell wall biosynthesis